ncbi:MAG: acetate--CoA ligase family protein, partial [Alphaproteobacteria bacterium]|nr:acetate--CoA ligase family protein [Alphaproteobacteria bacterium]
MNIHEYQAKELLAKQGIPVPAGYPALSAEEAVEAAGRLPGPLYVVKAQIHAGGRGKGRFKDSGKEWGGVKFVRAREEVGRVAELMFKHPLVTRQTGDQGQRVGKVLVQEAADIAREIYIGMVIDRAIGLPVLMACAEGGVEIEEVAARSPEKILKAVVDPDAGLRPHQARRLAYDLG